MTERDQCIALEKRIRDMETWAAEHDGRINTLWEEQTRTNHDCKCDRKEIRGVIETKFAVITRKLTALEVKVAVYSSLAAAGGAAVSGYLF